MALRILFTGASWLGSDTAACARSLIRLGCEVQHVDPERFFPDVASPISRLARRALAGRWREEYNRRLEATARWFHPDILLVFKGNLTSPRGLRRLRPLCGALYNFYPDSSPFGHRDLDQAIFPEFDCVFTTKHYWNEALRERLHIKEMRFIAHGYDADLHKPCALDERDRELYAHDLTLIAYYTPHKEAALEEIVRQTGAVDLKIWGDGWKENCRSRLLRSYVAGHAITGVSYVKAICAAKINLGIMSGNSTGVFRADDTTTRSFNIPACGGFMLHERTDELLTYYAEDREVACFGSAAEAAEKIERYLSQPEERAAIAAAGHRRCVPAYSYDARMAELLRLHAARQTPDSDQ